MKATVNGQEATIVSGTGTSVIRVHYTFTALEAEPDIPSVSITGIEPPVTGAVPDGTAVAEGNDYTVASVGWEPADNVFLAGKEYGVILNLEAVDGKKFSPNVTAVVNGRAARVISGAGSEELRISCTFPKLEAEKPVETPYVFPFTDVPVNSWYYESVKGANQMGLIAGTSATGYSPNNSMTFAEAVKLAACMHQLYTNGEVTLEVGSSKWYSSYYDYCRDNGIISAKPAAGEPGYDELLSKAGEIMTRKDYAFLFSRALPEEALPEVNTIPDNSIPDVKSAGSVYDQAIYKLYRAGIVAGTDAKGTFKPDSTIHRSEVAAILIRMMDPGVRVGAPRELGA